MIGLLCTALGKTPAEVGTMTLPEANRLCVYWRDHPPVHLLVAAALGVKPKSATASQQPSGDIGQLLGAAKGGILKAADLHKLG